MMGNEVVPTAVVSPAAIRRRRCDAAQRAAGRTRLGVWLDPDAAAAVDALMKAWSFADRGEAIDWAIRYLAKQTRDGLVEIDVL